MAEARPDTDPAEGFSYSQPAQSLEHLKGLGRSSRVWGSLPRSDHQGPKVLVVVLSSLCTAVINTLTKSSIRGERVHLAYTSQSQTIVEEAKTRTQAGRQRLRQRPQGNTAYCLPPHGWLSQVSPTTWDHLPRNSTTTSMQSLVKKMLTQPTGHSDRGIFSL